MAKLWLLEYTRWPGYDSYSEVVGVYSTPEKAMAATPYTLEWQDKHSYSLFAEDQHGDHWCIYPESVDAPVTADMPTWEE